MQSQFTPAQFSSFSGRFDFERIRSDTNQIQSKFSNLRSFQQFFNLQSLSKPTSLANVKQRLYHNFMFFFSNYLLIFTIFSFYALIKNLLLLFGLVFMIVSLYLINSIRSKEIKIGSSIKLSQTQLYVFVFIISIPILLYSSAFSVIFWLFSVSGSIIFTHAIMFEKPMELYGSDVV
ncbi:PRA1 family protein ASCRUDRAFT_34467 [Ascoidea rubescens DSM 1968]|uniref:PRA1 family protein n=1 Tax=Ascoidea rubescens DSM 1968 TaxID=1344418 RepID=A0A1D2VHM3_9ASCO|nr:hypothetical protein ASCRUDRAFT_34467 [Ascoidea rubescens DSM 1968]ODV61136.1 hypothetical protein ASCRUDRAFT_34467 [Ascoidea rubescens DSM 1968]